MILKTQKYCPCLQPQSHLNFQHNSPSGRCPRGVWLYLCTVPAPTPPGQWGAAPWHMGLPAAAGVLFQHAWCSSQIADPHYPCGPEEACKKMLKVVSNLQNIFLLWQSIVPPTGWHVGTESDMTCQPGISAEMLLSCAERADGRVSPHLRRSWFCKGCFS